MTSKIKKKSIFNLKKNNFGQKKQFCHFFAQMMSKIKKNSIFFLIKKINQKFFLTIDQIIYRNFFFFFLIKNLLFLIFDLNWPKNWTKLSFFWSKNLFFFDEYSKKKCRFDFRRKRSNSVKTGQMTSFDIFWRHLTCFDLFSLFTISSTAAVQVLNINRKKLNIWPLKTCIQSSIIKFVICIINSLIYSYIVETFANKFYDFALVKES